MICPKHNRYTPLSKCLICEKEEEELEIAVRLAELENSIPIVVWEKEQFNDNQ